MILKCKMCGGDITFSPGETHGQCEYCGSSCTIPKVDEEQKLNRYNRANHYRRQSEFDKAVTAYERILEEDDTDAEAHWGVVLSRYGIEYVEDPATGKRMPTCHRVQVDSILADEDYLAAVANAPDTASRSLYEAQAREIAGIQKDILAISRTEKPYDVFICYKETDEEGRRTRDSALAQEVYYELTEQGYKVFFSRITLEDKLGQQYEPYIFAALNSARVMVVIGTRPEHFSAVWVKNEWSRYLSLMRNDRKRLLIPCYRDMDPYDLPEELGSLQSQDMSKIGFMQDLIRGIGKVLEDGGKAGQPNGAAQPAVPQPVPVMPAASAAPLLRRAFMFLEDGDWQSADDYAEKVLDLEPENAGAYQVKLMAERRIRREDDLADGDIPLKKSGFYEKILRFAAPDQKARIEGWNRTIEDRLERKRRSGILAAARQKIAQAGSVADIRQAMEPLSAIRGFEGVAEALAEGEAKIEGIQGKEYSVACRLKERCQWDEAAAAFEVLGKYRDSAAMAEACREGKRNEQYEAADQDAKQGDWDKAADAFDTLGDYRDSRKRAADCRETIAEKARREAEERRQQKLEAERAAAEKHKRKSRIITICTIAIALILAAVPLVTHIIIPSMKYRAAEALREAGKYSEAALGFFELGDYGDAAEQAKATWYAEGVAKRDAHDWAGALIAFGEAGDYSDAAAQIPATRYAEGMAKRDAQDWDGSVAAFALAGSYSDAAVQIPATRYAEGMAKQAAQDWDGAAEAFALAGGYGDAAAQISETKYRQAVFLASEGDYDGAVRVFSGIRGYRDVDSLLENDRDLSAAAKAREARLAPYMTAGSYVAFGTYPQTASGLDSTPIEWLVLEFDADNNRALLISRYGLDTQPYNSRSTPVTWKMCSLRAWLNGTFLNEAFNAAEQAAILTTTVDNSINQSYGSWGTSGGADTEDKVFLLSCAEADRYFGVTYGDSRNVKAQAEPTAYASKQGAIASGSDKTADGNAAGWWWLRSPGGNQGVAAYVREDGSLRSNSVSAPSGLVRPVIWIDLDAGIF